MTEQKVYCGLDVHKETAVACIIKGGLPDGSTDIESNAVSIETRTFKTLQADLIELKDWLVKEGCHHVAMESTGIYWCPIYDVLETAWDGDIEIFVCNARDMHNLPGRKSDMKDARWIAFLLRAGLLKTSFIPEHGIRHLRQLTRYRKHIVEDITTQKNRIEKYLQITGFKLSTFLTDIFGVSGRALLDILSKHGTITPTDVEKELRGTAKKKTEDMRYALNGKLDKRGRQYLTRMLEMLDELLKHLSNMEEDIEEVTLQYKPQIEQLQTIPGIGKTAAKAIIGETGVDMSHFENVSRFCSWAGLSPGENESAGKKKAHESLLETPI